MQKLVLLFALLLVGCSAAIDLPTPTPTATAQIVAAISIPPTITPSPTPTARRRDTCTVNTGVPAGYLNLRNGAGTQYPVLRVLHEGEVLTVNERGAWLEVTDADGLHGFINSNYCR